MTAITATEARRQLFGLIEQVNDDNAPVEITSKRGSAILISEAEYRSLQETSHLLRSPANARRLLRSLEEAQAGRAAEHKLTQ